MFFVGFMPSTNSPMIQGLTPLAKGDANSFTHPYLYGLPMHLPELVYDAGLRMEKTHYNFLGVTSSPPGLNFRSFLRLRNKHALTLHLCALTALFMALHSPRIPLTLSTHSRYHISSSHRQIYITPQIYSSPSHDYHTTQLLISYVFSIK